ncbi:MAG TPA: alpha/beta fold hydrolase [Thermoanaerobaculia bacterium]|nr:alpha/beta fold hydrolase [Thermoanaerobaculia bacterium]
MIALFAAASLASSLRLAPCTIAGAAARCGTFDVRESPRSSRTLALKVIVLAAREHNDSAIFPFSGGPGIATTPGAEEEVKYFGAEMRRHDVVLVDQRGTGGSAPLRCPDAQKKHARELIEVELFPLPFVTDCRREIEKESDLSAYGTAQFADDVDVLRRALGYGGINIVGISYGTRSALTFLQRHPKAVQTLLLEGPLPPENPMPLYTARDAQSVLDRIIADCKSEPSCAKSFPDIAGDLNRALTALDAKAARFDAGEYHVTMTRGAFGEFLRSQMYAADRQSLIPKMLHLAAAGDWSWIGTYWLRSRKGWYDEIGPFLSISCAGDIRRIDPATIPAATLNTFLGDYRVRRQIAACNAWAPGSAPRVIVPTIDVPVLILAGDRDPVTPRRWAEVLQAQLKRARTIVFANTGHTEPSECAAALEVAFFDAGSFDHLDVSCAKAFPRAAYATKLP